MNRRLRTPVCALLLAGAIGACGDDAQFTARHAAEFVPQDSVTVSVFGVFKDGIMSADAWDVLGPRLSRGLHADKCIASYTADHLGKDVAVAQAIDDYARDSGITDDLLGEIAPSAEGDLIVAFTVAGHAPKSPDAGASFSSMTRGPSPQPIRGGMMNRPPRGSSGGARKPKGAYEVAASFYSPKLKRSVALLSMVYTGASEDEALTLFVEKLGQFAPHATCAGVKDVALDAEKIRALSQGS